MGGTNKPYIHSLIDYSMAKRKGKSNIKIALEMIVTIVLGIFIWNLGLLTFIGYILAFIGAVKNGLFKRRKDMAKKLFFGTILIYCAGLLTPFIFTSLKSGDMLSGILMLLLATYFFIKGFSVRKHGKKI